MSEDIAAIAKGLTKAQRKYLMEDRWAVWPVWRSFEREGIVSRGIGNILRLTPLGLAVRAHLTAGDASSGMGGDRG